MELAKQRSFGAAWDRSHSVRPRGAPPKRAALCTRVAHGRGSRAEAAVALETARVPLLVPSSDREMATGPIPRSWALDDLMILIRTAAADRGSSRGRDIGPFRPPPARDLRFTDEHD
jgi:hypothetical protein